MLLKTMIRLVHGFQITSFAQNKKTVSKADKEWRSKYVRAKDVFSKYSNLNTDEKINFLTVLETKCISVQDSSRSLDVFNRQL